MAIIPKCPSGHKGSSSFVWEAPAEDIAVVKKGEMATLTTLNGVLEQNVVNIIKRDMNVEAYNDSYDLKIVGTQKVKLVSADIDYVFDEAIGTYAYQSHKRFMG